MRAHLYANIFTASGAAISYIFGIIYLVKPSFLSYHSAATRKRWIEVDPLMQTLILALMRGVSGGAILAGFIISVLQYQFGKVPQNWIPPTILSCGGILTCTSVYAMLLVRTRTPARPPVIAVMLSIILLGIGYYFNMAILKE